MRLFCFNQLYCVFCSLDTYVVLHPHTHTHKPKGRGRCGRRTGKALPRAIFSLVLVHEDSVSPPPPSRDWDKGLAILLLIEMTFCRLICESSHLLYLCFYFLDSLFKHSVDPFTSQKGKKTQTQQTDSRSWFVGTSVPFLSPDWAMSKSAGAVWLSGSSGGLRCRGASSLFPWECSPSSSLHSTMRRRLISSLLLL